MRRAGSWEGENESPVQYGEMSFSINSFDQFFSPMSISMERLCCNRLWHKTLVVYSLTNVAI